MAELEASRDPFNNAGQTGSVALASCYQPEVHSLSLRGPHHGKLAAMAPAVMKGASGIETLALSPPLSHPHKLPAAQAINSAKRPYVPKAAKTTPINFASPMPNPSGRRSDSTTSGRARSSHETPATAPKSPAELTRPTRTNSNPNPFSQLGILLQRRSVTHATRQTAMTTAFSTHELAAIDSYLAP